MFVADQLIIESDIALQPDATSYAQASKRPVKVTEKKQFMDAANKGKNPAPQTKRVQNPKSLKVLRIKIL